MDEQIRLLSNQVFLLVRQLTGQNRHRLSLIAGTDTRRRATAGSVVHRRGPLGRAALVIFSLETQVVGKNERVMSNNIDDIRGRAVQHSQRG